jgi:chromosome segregation ATPase
MSTMPVPPKQDVPKELWAVVTTLSDDAENAALRKCQELGFDTNKGMISLEETLINLSAARDILLDAVDKGKLTQLPLRLQYSLLSQSRKVAEFLTALVNGTDAVINLVESVEDITASIWQSNLRNLSGEVLGLNNKMNQLKVQETRIRQVSREAEELTSLHETAKQMVGQISNISTAAGVQKAALQASTEEANAILMKVTEQGQKVSTVATQVEQHGTTVTQLLANSKQASADTEAIANKSKELQSEIDATRSALQALTSKAQDLLTSTQAASTTQLLEFKTKYEELSSNTQSATSALTAKLDAGIAELTTDANAKIESSAAALGRTGTDLETKITQLIADSTLRLTQAEAGQELRLAAHVKDFAEDTQIQMKSQVEAFDAQTTSLASKAEASINAGQDEFKRLVGQLDELEGRIKDAIERATGFTLFHSFQKRQQDIARAKDFWAWALLASVLISLASIRYIHLLP